MSIGNQVNDGQVNFKLLKNDLASLIDIFYPVGSIYTTTSNDKPFFMEYGKWELITDKFLVGAGNSYINGSTGGEATHTLTGEEMPSHTHGFNSITPNGDTFGFYGGGGAGGWGIKFADGNNNNYGKFGIQYAGSSQAHNNLPPYLAVNMYKRVE